ncbi:MAG: outer membrane protein assembly factor BamD [Deltaproteobacteria bacterium]|nr:MAG: outer membrane protein assembly factor BamD [Deltaproteobacteria bacterium]
MDIRCRWAVVLAMLLFMAFTAFGCGMQTGDKSEKSAAELAAEGMQFFEKKKYAKAIDTFQGLKEWYPFDELAIMAEQKIPESHYRMAAYEDAVFGFAEFERLHPTHPNLPEVIYLMGMCYYDRMDAVDRDPSSARTAFETFARLKGRFPEAANGFDVDEKIKKCREHLAAHEMYVGRFYFKTKHYQSALGRFETILRSYPDVTMFQKEAGEYVIQCNDAIAASESIPDGADAEKVISQ